MPIIQRPVKQFGFRTYTADFNAAPVNPTPPPSNLYQIQTAEVDADLDTIYALINGGLDNSNIAAGANISGTKLADTSIPLGKLATTGFQRVAITTGLTFNTVETALAVLPSLTTTGGRVRLEASPVTLILAPTASGPVTFKWYEDAVLLAGSTVNVGTENLTANIIIVPLPCPTFVRDGAVIAPHVYSLHAVTASANISVATDGTHAGELYATEVP